MGNPKREEDPHKKGDQPPPTEMEDARRQSRVFGPGPDRKEGIRYTPGKKRVHWRENKRHLRGP